jgi:GT2 family glycosyltransferase
MNTSKVSVVIVNFNGAEHLRTCLPSLQKQSCSILEIIVVDNCSSDESVKVTRNFQATWLPLEQNVGLAPALNIGAAAASGEFLLFVNNDMRFAPEFVSYLLKALENDPNLLAADGMQFDWDGNVRAHMAARLSQSPGGEGSTELVPGLYFHQTESAQQSPVFMASAACMMVRRSVFEKVGKFDDRLPLGYEDVEICWRAWIHGHGTVYVPSAICWHKLGVTQGTAEGRKFSFRGIVRGRLLLATKLLPRRYALRTWANSIGGLAKDALTLDARRAADRLVVLFRTFAILGVLLNERKSLFNHSGNSPQSELTALLGLPSARK